MYKLLISFILLLTTPFNLLAQITPAEGTELNYRVIGFSFPQVNDIIKYDIEIATGGYNNDDFFQKNIISTFSSKKNKVIARVPAFGAQYTWRVIYTYSHAPATKSELHHFNTGISADVNTDSARLHILTPDLQHDSLYVFIDASKTLYDLEGNAVWYLPHIIEGNPAKLLPPRDIKRSDWGTITFMMNERAYEINYGGKILWQEPEANFSKEMPPDEKTKFTNHFEFTHLANGHYMTMGMELNSWDVSGAVKTTGGKLKSKIITDSNGKLQQRIRTGRIIEFDQKHNIAWSWSAAAYYKQSDLFYRRRPNGLFKAGAIHENGFYFDESAKTVYISLRSIDRIVKIGYPGGKVLSTYGELYEPGNLEMGNDLFCSQQCCRRSREGYLYLFNNNTCNRLCNELPKIIMMREPTKPKGRLKKVWEYECTLDGMGAEEQSRLKFETGGSVVELPDRSILCCMAGNYSKTFIVNRDKKILWSALPEKWNSTEGKWKVLPGYRASFITREELEHLIWGEPSKK